MKELIAYIVATIVIISGTVCLIVYSNKVLDARCTKNGGQIVIMPTVHSCIMPAANK